METFNRGEGEGEIIKGVRAKLNKGITVAADRGFIAQELRELYTVMNNYYKGYFGSEQQQRYLAPILKKLNRHAIFFETIAEYSLAFDTLVSNGWLSREMADEILDHGKCTCSYSNEKFK
jgi:hypothetical protein